MRELRWPEVQRFLMEQATESTDFRKRDLATSALEVYEPDWPGGEVYRTYDPAAGLKTYVGLVWSDDESEIQRIRFSARNSAEARAVAEAEHGPDRRFSVWNEEDAARPRDNW